MIFDSVDFRVELQPNGMEVGDAFVERRKGTSLVLGIFYLSLSWKVIAWEFNRDLEEWRL